MRYSRLSQHQSKQGMTPQPPQLVRLPERSVPGMHGNGKQAVVVSAHAPLQQLNPAPQSASVAHPHWPLLQVLLPVHATRHAPQF